MVGAVACGRAGLSTFPNAKLQPNTTQGKAIPHAGEGDCDSGGKSHKQGDSYEAQRGMDEMGRCNGTEAHMV